MKKLLFLIITVFMIGSFAFADDTNYLSEESADHAYWNDYHAVRWVNDTSEPVRLFMVTYDPDEAPDLSLKQNVDYVNGWWYNYHYLQPGEVQIYYARSTNVYWFAASDDKFWGDGDTHKDFPNEILDISYDAAFPFTNEVLEGGYGSQSTIHIKSYDSYEKSRSVKFKNDTWSDLILYVKYTDVDGDSRERFISLDYRDDVTINVSPGYRNMYWSAITDDSDYYDYDYWGENKDWRDGESRRDFLRRIDEEYELDRSLIYNHEADIMTLND